MSRRIIFVMGMGRSGTSTVAGILKSLGVEWGSAKLMLSPAGENSRGFWEFTPLTKINIRLLERLGGDWHSPPNLPAGWENRKDLDDLRSEAVNEVYAHFKTMLWGFKDPRCCLTLPFWRTVIRKPIECVFVFRNPLEVAHSLLQRDKFPVERGSLLWLLNVSKSWSETEGLRRHCLCYEDLLDDPAGEVARLEQFLERQDVTVGEREQAFQFISKDLRHERSSMEDLFKHPAIPYPVKAVYSAIRLFVIGQKAGNSEGLELMNELLRKQWS